MTDNMSFNEPGLKWLDKIDICSSTSSVPFFLFSPSYTRTHPFGCDVLSVVSGGAGVALR